jgi:hypothetical protein
MARGTSFGELVVQLRNETGRSADINVGVDDLPRLKQAINSAYEILWDGNDWPHLRSFYTRIALSAGSRYYDWPDDLVFETAEKVTVWFNDQPQEVKRGIGSEEYSLYSSEDDDRSDPVMRWDVRWTGTEDQIEVWPLPSTNTQELQIEGRKSFTRLVNDADLCLLDDTLVVKFAAADVLGEKAGKMKLAAGQDRLKKLTGRGHVTSRYTLGTGGGSTQPSPVIAVRVSG